MTEPMLSEKVTLKAEEHQPPSNLALVPASTNCAIEAEADGATKADATKNSTFTRHRLVDKLISMITEGRDFLALLAALVLIVKFVFVWILAVLLKPVIVWSRDRLPEIIKTKWTVPLPQWVSESQLLRDLNEGLDQGLPFILYGLYLCCAPFAILWMAFDWVSGCFPVKVGSVERDSLSFVQNKKTRTTEAENNFYHSRSFGIVLLTVFVLGLPALFTYQLYERLDIQPILQSGQVTRVETVANRMPLSGKPRVGLGLDNYDSKPVVGEYRGYWPWLRNFGVEPSKRSIFFVDFYLASVASVLCALFFRAWFTFPLNFFSDEQEIVFTAAGIRRKSFKGWFKTVITLNGWANAKGPDSLRWDEIRTLSRTQDGFTKLCPLPETAFAKETLTYKLLNKCAALIDGVSRSKNVGSYLVFSTAANPLAIGGNITINLHELNREQRAKLFYGVKKWAPHVVLTDEAQEQLLGANKCTDSRYTHLWFDMLTSRSSVKRTTDLVPGESLKSGEYTIEKRMSSGGQATAYLARNSSGKHVVLKEFILATSSSSAMLASALDFEAEVSLLSQLNHPGIVKVEDYFSEDCRAYVVLEYIEGESLAQKVREQGPLSEAEVIAIAGALCDILEHLHDATPPIIHRDITPQNILVQADGAIKLIDFSVAVKQGTQRTTSSCGKQCFTPPEQFRGEPGTQSDIYAVGATLFYLLTGKTPKPISKSSPNAKGKVASEQLNAIVERATELDLSERYQAASWMKIDLSQID